MLRNKKMVLTGVLLLVFILAALFWGVRREDGSAKDSYLLHGICSWDGECYQSFEGHSAATYPDFAKVHPCQLVEEHSKRVVYTFPSTMHGDVCPIGAICLGDAWTLLVTGARVEREQYVFKVFGDGGQGAVTVYTINVDDGTARLIKETFSDQTDHDVAVRKATKECGDPATREYYDFKNCMENYDSLPESTKSRLNEIPVKREIEYFETGRKYHIDDYVWRSMRSYGKNCRCENAFKPECDYRLKPKGSKECNDPDNPMFRRPDCYENAGELPPDVYAQFFPKNG